METLFYNSNGLINPRDFRNMLLSGFWKHFNVDNYFYNNKKMDVVPLLPYFENITTVVPGTKLNSQTFSLYEDKYFPNFVKTNLYEFLEVAFEYFNKFKDNTIGVHLSGGLDSSIIICLLKYFNIPFKLVGIRVNTFEFRTERIIQNRLSELGDGFELINLENYPPYSKLSELPLVNTPTEVPSKHYWINHKVVEAFKKMQVDVVFTGQGGDSLFVDAPNNEAYFNFGYEFYTGSESFYNDNGISLISFYSDPIIVDHIFSLRKADKCLDDPLKKWARSFFKFILPAELSEFCYTADFFGTSLLGLHNNREEISYIVEVASEFTGLTIFNNKSLNKFLSSDIFSFGYRQYCDFNAYLSLAIWYHSLARAGALKIY